MSLPPVGSSRSRTTAHLLELSSRNCALLHALANRSGLSPHIVVHNLAASSIPGNVTFRAPRATGSETGA
jgi:hypothetical protein